MSVTPGQVQLDAAKLEQRMPKWRTLTELLRFADVAENAEELLGQANAIRDQRLLLEEPDPVQPLLDELAGALRAALSSAYEVFYSEYDQQLSSLEEHGAWQKLSDDKASEFLQAGGLRRLKMPDVQSPESLASALKHRPLSELDAQTDALSSRFTKALKLAIEETAPRTRQVTIPRKVFQKQQEVESFIQDLKEELLRHVDDGHPVAIS